jgi:hypothetical protein
MSLKITFVTETFPPEVNGVAMTVGRLVSGMRERGHREGKYHHCNHCSSIHVRLLCQFRTQNQARRPATNVVACLESPAAVQ